MKNDVKNNECCEDKARKCDNLGPSQPTSLKNLYNKFINMKDCKWKYYDNSSSMNFETFNAVFSEEAAAI